MVLEVDEGDLVGFDGDNPFVGFHGGEAMFDGGFGDLELLQLNYYYSLINSSISRVSIETHREEKIG